MHVKESVKDFVHDVKRKFSQKRKRDSCSTCAVDSFDGASSSSSGDAYSHFDAKRESTSSSSLSSLPSTPERGRFNTFIRSRAVSTPSQKYQHNVLHKARKIDGKRFRLFSSERGRRTQLSAAESPASGSTINDVGTVTSTQSEYMDVIDISARSVGTGSTEKSTQSSFCDSLLQPQSRILTESSRSGTLITSTSTADTKSNPESDSPSDITDPVVLSSTPLLDPMTPEHPLPSPPSDPPSLPLPTTPAPPSPTPVYLPRLTAPSMFLPIPNTDPLSAHLTKYVPVEQRPRRDVVGEYAGRDVHEMVMSNSWRALAKMARDRIVASDPEDLPWILDLWSLRLSSLARLRLTNQASAECTNLFAVLNAVPPSSVPGSFPGSDSLSPSAPLSSFPAPAVSPLSPSGLSGLAQLPGTPSQKPITLPSSLAGGPSPSRRSTHELVYPFELTVFHARVHYWSGDPLGYVDALSRILGRCKERAREEARIVIQRKAQRNVVRVRGDSDGSSQSNQEQDEDEAEATEERTESTEIKNEEQEGGEDETEATEETESSETQDEAASEEEPDNVLTAAEANLSMWLERVARVCLILVSQMVEMNDYQAAINLLTPLCTHRVPPTFEPTPSPALHSALARVYLLSGNLEKAEEHFSIIASAAESNTDGTDYVVMNAALLAAASGDWARAEEALRELVDKDTGNFTAINNLAVVLLYQGKIKEGIDLLESALKTSPSSVVVAEPFLFNLSTLYELRSAAAIDKKRALLVEVAKWSGDGLRTSCLKMPSS